jgi:hypothetical protein
VRVKHAGGHRIRRPREDARAGESTLLPGVRAGVDDEAIAARHQAVFLRELARRPQKRAEQRLVTRFGFGHGGDVAVLQDQDVRRGLRVDVAEGSQAVVFVNDGGRERPGVILKARET